MKSLLLARHAKAGKGDPGTSDFERPLDKKGKNEADLMGDVLKEHGAKVDRIITSPAERTTSTARILAKWLGLSHDQVEEAPLLYPGEPAEIMMWIGSFDDDQDTVMILGHNPTISQLTDDFTGVGFLNLPTCGMAKCDIAVDTWNAVVKGSATLDWLDFPERHQPPK